MKNIKKILAAAASICMIASMSFSVYADENEEINAPDAVVTDIQGIVSDIMADTQEVPAEAELLTEPAVSYSSEVSDETDITSADETALTYTESETGITTYETSVNATVTDSSAETSITETVIKNSKDIIISLDISGSMYGEPMIAMKEAAIEFCTTMLKADPDAKIAVVSFETDSTIGVEFTNDLSVITAYIESLSDESLTNFSAAMSDIKFLLETGSGVEKNVILMADGLPNEGNYSYTGKYGSSHEYENYALEFENNNIKNLATVYTIGFFHNISNGDTKDFAKQFMSDLASSPSNYYDADITNLNNVFHEIAYDIVPEAKPAVTDVTVKVTEAAAANDGKVQESPKTSDTGVMSFVVLAMISGTVLVATKKKIK